MRVASLCPSLGGQGWQLEKFAEASVDDFAGLSEEGVANDFVAGVELGLAVFDEEEKEGGEVARVHLAGVIGHGAGEVVPADDGDAVDADFFSPLGELAIAAALGSEVDDYGAGGHAGDHFLGDEHGRGFAGDDGGGDEDRFVSADGAHGGEGVHALRARGAGHEFDGEGGDPFGGDVLNGFDGAEGAEKADKNLVAVKERKVGFAGAVVGAVAEDLGDDVGGAKDFGAIRDNLCALGYVIGVGITGLDTGTGFQHDLQARFGQIGNHRGHQRNAPLPRKTFAGNTDNHEGPSDTPELDLILFGFWPGRIVHRVAP